MLEGLIGIIGVVVGSVLTTVKDWMLSSGQRRRERRYLCIRVICIFETFIRDCVDVMHDDGLAFGQRDQEGCLRPQVRAPTISAMPSDVDWKSVKPDLAYRVLSFPMRLRQAEDAVSFASDISGPPDFDEYFEQREGEYAKLGLAAYQLVLELQELGKLAELSGIDQSDRALFEQKLQEIGRLQEERATHAAAMFQDIQTKGLPPDHHQIRP